MSNWKLPYKGQQTVQTHTPRIYSKQVQVSTYNGDAWIITLCPQSKVSQVKKTDLKRALDH